MGMAVARCTGWGGADDATEPPWQLLGQCLQRNTVWLVERLHGQRFVTRCTPRTKRSTGCSSATSPDYTLP